MSDRIIPNDRIKEIISNTYSDPPKLSDIVYYYDEAKDSIESCLFIESSKYKTLFAFKTYEDAKECESYIKAVLEEISESLMQSMYRSYANISEVKFDNDEQTKFTVNSSELKPITCATNIVDTSKIKCGEGKDYFKTNRYRYLYSDMNKVIAYYKGLEE